MKNIEKHILSNQYIVYKTKYLENYSKENFIKQIKQNKNIIDKKIEKKVEDRIVIECDEFNLLNQYIVDILSHIENKKINNIAKLSWVYTQKTDFNMIMHKHDYLYYTTEKTSLKTDWTCVFYLQIPQNLQDGEGDVIFMTEDKKLHRFVPEENDILIFSGTLNHMVTQIPNAEMDRIVFATNFNLNIY